MRKFVICCLLFASTTCFAADRKLLIRQLMDAQGLSSMLQEQMSGGKEQAEAQATQLLDQMIGALKADPEYQDRVRKAIGDFVVAFTTPPWSAQDIVDEWAKAYAPEFSDQELEQLLAYYTSPLGKKDVAATQKALPIWTARFVESFKPIQDRAIRRYAEDLNRIARDAKAAGGRR